MIAVLLEQYDGEAISHIRASYYTPRRRPGLGCAAYVLPMWWKTIRLSTHLTRGCIA